jgi:broad specificity phosphatase PhoE
MGMVARQLILVRHSIVRQELDTSSHDWSLTEEGRARCLKLAKKLEIFAPDVIVSSPEPKARQTAQALVDALHAPLEFEDGLREHQRKTAPFFPNVEDFRAIVEELLLNPYSLVFGEETGEQARQRFQSAIETIFMRHPTKTILAVTHGTVMALYMAQAAQVDPVMFWRNLGMPAYVVLQMPDGIIIKQENEVK